MVAKKSAPKKKAKAGKHPGGRPSSYTKELGDTICARMIELGSLRKVCSAEDMPDKSSVFRWLIKADDEENVDYVKFRDQYARARRIAKEYQFDAHWEDLEEAAKEPVIIDDVPLTDKDGNIIKVATSQSVAFARLKHDAFKWQSSKEDPKKYGEFARTEITGKDGGAIETSSKIDLSDLSKDERAALAGIIKRRTK